MDEDRPDAPACQRKMQMEFSLQSLFSVQTFVTVMEYIGVLAGAISGIRISSAKHFDVFGAYVVGLVTAIGGGSLRDAMLGAPMFWMRQPGYLVCTFCAVFLVWAFGRRIVHDNLTWFVFDTIGLALFTVLGVQKSLEMGHEWWIAVVMGMITGAAGGVLRDVLVNDVPLIFRSELYATASMLGAGAYCVAYTLDVDMRVCSALGGGVVVAVRFLAMRFRLSLPKISNRANIMHIGAHHHRRRA